MPFILFCQRKRDKDMVDIFDRKDCEMKINALVILWTRHLIQHHLDIVWTSKNARPKLNYHWWNINQHWTYLAWQSLWNLKFAKKVTLFQTYLVQGPMSTQCCKNKGLCLMFKTLEPRWLCSNLFTDAAGLKLYKQGKRHNVQKRWGATYHQSEP